MRVATDYIAYNKKFFRRYAPVYDLLVRPLAWLRRDVVAASNARPGQTVLDVACGTGEQSLAFAHAGCSVVGVDLSKDMLDRARAKVRTGLDVRFIEHDASSLPFAAGSFDVTTVSLALHDMPLNVARRVLAEMRRVTKPEGVIVVVDHANPAKLTGKLIHAVLAMFESRWFAAFMRIGLTRLLAEAGIRVRIRQPRCGGAFEVVTGSAVATENEGQCFPDPSDADDYHRTAG